MRPSLRLVPSLLLAAVVAAGCGSSASSSQTAQVQFVADANAVCAKAARLGHELSTPPKNVTETIAFFDKTREIFAQAEHEFEALSPPASSRAAYRRFLAAIVHEADSLTELDRAARAGDKARYRATTKKMEANTVNQQATALGLGDCAETTQPQGK